MRKDATPNMSVAERLLQKVSLDLSAATFEQADTPDKELEKLYFDDPAGFVSDVLGEVVTDDIKRLMESVRDNPVTFGQSANGTGKTHGAARVIAWWYKTRQGAQVYTAAAPPEDNLKRLLWGEISNVLEKNRSLFAKDKISISSMEVKRAPLEFITGVTIPQNGDPASRKARFSGKHAPFLLFVIDEGDALPQEIYEAIESCMSGGHARLLVLFNPRSASGPIFNYQQKKQGITINLSAFNHPNVITGNDIIPGAVTREATVRRINEWTRPMIEGERTEDVFYIPEYLVGATAKNLNSQEYYPPLKPGLRKIIEPAFAYMVLGKYSSQTENQLINRDWCMQAMDRYRLHVLRHGEVPPLCDDIRLGIDVAEFGDDFSVCTLRYGHFIAPQRTFAGVDIKHVASQGTLLYTDHGVHGAYIDANGLGSGVWPLMRDAGCVAHRIMVQESATEVAMINGEVIGQFERMRDQGWWIMREFFREGKAMLPFGSDEPGGLIDQLCAATYSKNKRGRIKICDNDVFKSKLNGKSPDNATSLMLTFCPENDNSTAVELKTTNYMY